MSDSPVPFASWIGSTTSGPACFKNFDQQRPLKKLKFLMKTILSRSHRLEIDDAMQMWWKPRLQGLPWARILSLAWLGWYADSRLRHTAGLIFVLRLKVWSLCSRTALYSCKDGNRWQSAHELMSSQAREISASKKCANLCPLDAAVTLVSVSYTHLTLPTIYSV